jgi:polysaccharide export outer membrane protein
LIQQENSCAIENMTSTLVLIGLLFTASAPRVIQAQAPAPANPSVPPSTTPLPSDYVIGVEDVLSVIFWREKDMSAEVVVRPDGKISLPMLNDIHAAGMTPEALAESIAKVGTKFVRDAGATVIVKEIRSRKIYIIGEVSKPGTFQLGSEMTVLQAIGEAGGFIEGANKGDVKIVRNQGGKEQRFKFNYKEVVEGKNPQQNIKLQPGDTIIVR